jgi:hypothetical protein
MPQRRQPTLLRALALAAGAVWFVIDVLLLPLLRPLARRIAGWPVWRRVEAWTVRLPPYPTLLVFLVPVLLLEPVKPLAAWLAASGHGALALLLFGVTEAIKLVVVERLFHANRAKLLTIGWFARLYGLWTWLKLRVTQHPAWRAARRRIRAVWLLLRRSLRMA